MLVNLNCLFEKQPNLTQLKGVEVIDSCLTEQSGYLHQNNNLIRMMKSPKKRLEMGHESPKKNTPRKRYPPKHKGYVNIDKPSGFCPKCRKFVKEQGVECKKEQGVE